MPDEIINAISSEALDMAINIGELSLDTILQEGVLRDIPVLGTISSLYHMASNIQNAIFLRNIGAFLFELKTRNFKDKSHQLLLRIASDDKFRKKVSDTILIFNAKFDNAKKAKIFAKILLALAEQKVNELEFEMICGIISDLTVNDYNIIIDIAVSPPKKYEDILTRNPFSLEMQIAGLQKMIWLGVLTNGPMSYENMDNITKRIFSLTDVGKKLYLYGISET